MLGIPLGWSWLQLTNQSLQSDATQILDEVRRDVEERNAEGRPIDAAMLQQRIDQQTDLNISITVTTAEGETISAGDDRSEEHTSELQSRGHLVCRLLLEKKNRA